MSEASNSSGKVIKPGGTIGILGGGQLGRMLALAGRNMGYRFVTLDPTDDAPCGQVADEPNYRRTMTMSKRRESSQRCRTSSPTNSRMSMRM